LIPPLWFLQPNNFPDVIGQAIILNVLK